MSEVSRKSDDERVITCWYRLTGEEAGFNHISDGYNEGRPNPQPINDFQKQAWRNQQWEGRKATLINGVVVENRQEMPMRWS